MGKKNWTVLGKIKKIIFHIFRSFGVLVPISGTVPASALWGGGGD